jgi:hypothetical protein
MEDAHEDDDCDVAVAAAAVDIHDESEDGAFPYHSHCVKDDAVVVDTTSAAVVDRRVRELVDTETSPNLTWMTQPSPSSSS